MSLAEKSLEKMSFDEGLKLVAALYSVGPAEKRADIGQDLSQFWSRLPREAQTAAMGAGAGSLGGLAATLLQPERRRNYGRNALTGALIGGMGGAVAPSAWKGIQHLMAGEREAPGQQAQEQRLNEIQQQIDTATDVDPLTGKAELSSRATKRKQLLGPNQIEAATDIVTEPLTQGLEGLGDIGEAAMIPGQERKALSGLNKIPWLGMLTGGYTAAGAGPGHKPFDVRSYKTLADDWLNALPMTGEGHDSKIRTELDRRVTAKTKGKNLFDPVQIETKPGRTARPAGHPKGARPAVPAEYKNYTTSNLLRQARSGAPPKKPGGLRRGFGGLAVGLATELGRRHLPGISNFAPEDSIRSQSNQTMHNAEMDLLDAVRDANK